MAEEIRTDEARATEEETQTDGARATEEETQTDEITNERSNSALSGETVSIFGESDLHTDEHIDGWLKCAL